MSIAIDSLLSLEAWHKHRKLHKPELMAHRRLRSVRLGEHMTLQFEDERTIRYQIQEMLRIEKIFDEEGIQAEIDAYAPLVPDGSNSEGHAAARVPRRARAAPRTCAPDRGGAARVRRGGGRCTAGACDRRRGPRARDRRKDLGRALPALRVRAVPGGGAARRCRGATGL